MPPGRCDEARVWCQKKGWKAFFSLALQGDKDDSRSWTAKVAMLVRESLGLACWTAGLQEPATQISDTGFVPAIACWHCHAVGPRGSCGGQWILVLEPGAQGV